MSTETSLRGPRVRAADRLRPALVALAVLAAATAPEAARAAPIARCALRVSTPTPLLGERVALELDVENAATASPRAGFVPVGELFLPPGLTLAGATSVVGAVEVTTVGTFAPLGTLTHPLTGESIVGPPGASFHVLRLPLSSLTPEAGPMTVTASVDVAPSAPVGTALDVSADCAFAYGADALRDATLDPVVRGAPRRAVTLTPAVVRARAETSGPTVSGANFGVRLSIAVDVAAGQTVTGLELTQALDPRLVVTRTDAPGAALSTIGRTTTYTFASIVGGPGDTDARVALDGFVPERDANGVLVLDPTCGGRVEVPFAASFARGTLIPTLPAAPTPLVVAPVCAALPVQPVLVRERATNLTRPGAAFRPGDVAALTLDVEIADPTRTSSTTLITRLGAGLGYVAASASPAPTTGPSGDDPTTLTFALGALTGGAPGGTRRTITLRAAIDERYASGPSVLGQDVLSTVHTLAAAYTPPSGPSCASPQRTIEDDSGTAASLSIEAPTLSKQLVAVNGLPATTGAALRPGDIARFALTVRFPSGDQGGVTLTDYLPLPIMRADAYGPNPTIGLAASAAPLRFGPAHDLPPGSAVRVELSPPGEENALRFVVDPFTTEPSRPVVLDLRVDAVILDAPQEDGLRFTNLALARTTASGGATRVERAVDAFTVLEPALVPTLGVVSASNPRATITPAPPARPWTSTTLAARPIVGAAAGVDAGDRVRFALVVENRGRGAAWDVVLTATVPRGLRVPAGGPAIAVTDGLGAARTASGDLFGAGLALDGGGGPDLAPTDATSGANVVVVEYTLELDDTVAGGETSAPRAAIAAYASAAGGPSFVASPRAAATTIEVAPLALAVAAAPVTRTIGERAPLPLRLFVPEGVHPGTTVRVTLPAALAFVAASAGPLPSGVSATGALTPTIDADGRGLTLTLGTLVNAGRTDAERALPIDAELVVVNVGAANELDAPTLAASVAIGAPGRPPPLVRAAPLTIREPTIALTLAATPSRVDAQDDVRIAITIAATGAAGAPPAHDVVVSTRVPAPLTALRGLTTASGVAPTSASITGDTLTLRYARLDLGQSSVVELVASTPAALTLGARVDVDADATWTSLAGSPGPASPFEPASVERTGAGPAPDDYRVARRVTIEARAATAALTRVGTTTAAIADGVRYRVDVTVPEGTSPSLDVALALPPGLTFVGAAGLTASAPLACGAAPCALPTPTVLAGPSGQTITFPFGALGGVTNTDADDTTRESLAFDLTLAVADVAAARRGVLLAPSIAVDGGAPTIGAAVRVVEPALALTLAAAPSAVDAGDVVTVSVAIANVGVDAATAHDVALTVTLPPTLTLVPGSFAAGTCPTPSALALPTITFAALPAGATCTASVRAVVDANVTPGAGALVVGGAVVATSQPGVVVGERTGDPSRGPLHDYRAAAQASTLLADAAGVAIALGATSAVETSGAALAAGETATHRVEVRLSEGLTPSVQVRVTPPDGLAIDAVRLDTSAFGGVVGSDPSQANLGAAPGAALTFALGDVRTTADNVTTNDTLALVITTRAAYVPGGRVGDVAARLSTGGAPRGEATSPIRLVAPAPRLALVADVAAPGPGQATVLTASVRNDGSGPACAIAVTLEAPLALALDPAGSDGLDNDDDGAFDEPDEATLGGPLALTSTRASCLAPTETRRVRARARAATDVAPDPLTVRARLGAYRTLPAPAGLALSPTSDLVDEDGDGQLDEPGDDTLALTLTPRAPRLTLTKNAVDVNGGTLEPGDRVRYRIVAANAGNAPAPGVAVVDVLPTPRVSPVGATATRGALTLAGGTLTVDVGELAPAQSVVITLDVDVAAPLARGVRIANQATASTTLGAYPPLPSDDPATNAPRDATVLVVASTGDRDGDGVVDEDDPAPDDAFACGDTDADRCDDCARRGLAAPGEDGDDADRDGLCAVSDPDERDDDVDDDGLADGLEPRPFEDTDGDGLVNVRDADADDDGLVDGLERGVTTPPAGTDRARGVFVADADPTTTTDPLARDTDRGGAPDGVEDADGDGAIDAGETDPTLAADDAVAPPDADRDGLSDAIERAIGTDPRDADTDDDGVLDGAEANPTLDTDRDGLVNALDADADDDGLFDGTERGLAAPTSTATDRARGRFRADADPSSTTSMLRADTDGGGVRDGAEDADHDGAIDAGETDPARGDDDRAPPDGDADGLADDEERALGTDPTDADTDDDGLADGREPNAAVDDDGDGLIAALDPDADDDGLLDGTELGVTMPLADTDITRGAFVGDRDPTRTTRPLRADSDRGGAPDGVEDLDRDGRVSPGETDPSDPSDDVARAADADGDRLPDVVELAIGTSPIDRDSDDDGVLDGDEPNVGLDTDGDGRVNGLDPDADDDGLLDGTERGLTTPDRDTALGRRAFIADADPSTRTGLLTRDSDLGGVADGLEDEDRDGRVDPGETDPRRGEDDRAPVDTDNDGLPDATELAFGTAPNDGDSDDDGLLDGAETDALVDVDGDGAIDALDPDSDDDGLADGTERGLTQPAPDTDRARGAFVADQDPTTRTSMVRRDTDGGGLPDGAEDLDADGRVELGETSPTLASDDVRAPADADGDGLPDAVELRLGTDPRDRDTDDDGVLDGDEPNTGLDLDGDGLVGALDPDADDDGVLDGTERGLTTPDRDTAVARGAFVADADPSSTTSAVLADSDRGGAPDGAEDTNADGAYGAGETDPRDPADDAAAADDADGDGLADTIERAIGSDPRDPDSDDDGVLDGDEPNPSRDDDGDGLVNALDPDADDDGLLDGTERGVTAPARGTDLTRGHFVPDADPTTTTSPIRRDTDGAGASDGREDTNANGRVDADETDPRDPRDDASAPADGDGDGLADRVEARLGTDPADVDTDDDGVVDGDEPNPTLDSDGDGLTNARDPDADDDRVLDGTERGLTTPSAGTQLTRGAFVPDADPSTRTGVLARDTDRGGLVDGAEDVDHDGRVDAGERDPRAAADDRPAPRDTDGDGLGDDEERALGTRVDDRDSDDDGLVDGEEPHPGLDTDGDGRPNALDPDADGDGLPDGLERGRTLPDRDTDTTRGAFFADRDPSTTTSPLLADTDGGGARDGAEDLDRDGRTSPGEGDPRRADDDAPLRADADGDGLTDGEERAVGADPSDPDSDDDGVEDGDEADATRDDDRDGRANVVDPDADDDGLLDGTERGVTTAGPGTDVARGRFVADRDPTTTTSMVTRDTDRGGTRDGDEDPNLDGRQDVGEGDPRDPRDDRAPADADADGLSDALERALGLDPADADTDDDGVLDGDEADLAVDTDGDGATNARDPDADGDGLVDGTERGVTVRPAATATTTFVADRDPTTTTSMVAADSDRGGVVDGLEDLDHDGRVGPGETDPNRAGDDRADGDADGDTIPDADEGPGDVDGDGVPNALDLDADGDGVRDRVEAGDGDPATAPFDTDRDGTPDAYDLDADDDGVPDARDVCRIVRDADQRDTDENGVGDRCEVDEDGDGVRDAVDVCPLVSDVDQRDTDGDGKGDVCDADVDGDGIVDGVSLSGGGCHASGLGTFGWPLVAALALLTRRRRTRPRR